LIKQKSKSPSAASRGKPAQRKAFMRNIFLVLAGRAYFLLAPKETKLPARNFSVKVSR